MAKIAKSGAIGSAVVLAGGSASALLLALTAAPGGATTTLTIDSLADGTAVAADCTTPVVDSCSLRDALAAAATGDVIVFKSGLAGTITLTDGALEVTNALTLTGAGSAVITVDADGGAGVFYLANSAGDVTISGLTITGSVGDSAITAQNVGDLALIEVDVSGNSGAYGGGLYINNTGAFTLTDSNVSNNTSLYGGGGVYIYSDPTSVTIANTTIADNTADNTAGGILANFTGDLTIIDSNISGNTADGGGGGGLYANHNGDLTITDSTMLNNTSGTSGGGGAAWVTNDGSATISGSTFSGNSTQSWGGAFYFGTGGQEITISNSLFNDNSSASAGGALDFDARNLIVTINNTTIVGNTSGADGGGIWKDDGGSLTINQSTITENTASTNAGGIYISNGASPSLVLSGTIVSNNTVTGLGPRALPADFSGGTDISMDWVEGDVLTLDHSLVGIISDNAESEITDLGGNVRSSTPGLSALADNGGLTQTMALLSTSAAVDAGPSPVATFVGNEFDQRGTPYVRIYNGQVDIGAYEIQPAPAPTTTTTATSEPVTPKFAG